MASRAFHDFLREYRRGAAHDELSDALQELVGDIAQEGKAGKLVFTLNIKPAESKDGALSITDEIKVVPPKKTKGGSIFFVSPENNLVRDDPKQQRLPLREVAPGEAPRDIGSVPSSIAKALA